MDKQVKTQNSVGMDVFPGTSIREAAEDAIVLASGKKREIHFKFNGVNVVVSPGELPDDVVARWERDSEISCQRLINSDEYKEREKEREAQAKRAREAHMQETALTERQMRESEVPSPLTKEQLLEYIESLTNRQHDYGTCVYAMSMAAQAAFNYVAGNLGVSGFQASCAGLEFVRRVGRIHGPFIILRAEDALYPQYNLEKNLRGMLNEAAPWLKAEAKKKLEHTDHAHPAVIAHWEKLAKEL